MYVQQKYLIFDLDGTISDPIEGIMRSINYSLESHGFETKSEQQVAPHIGPPLETAFSDFTQQSQTALIHSLISKYRERYAEIGYAENSLYSGIDSILAVLYASQKYKLALCTSKREDFAIKILELFGIRQYFEFVSGGDIGIQKWQQLNQLCGDGVIDHRSIMIGDRYIDLQAAHKNNIPSAGVLWGYGSENELLKENPKFLLRKPKQLKQLIQ